MKLRGLFLVLIFLVSSISVTSQDVTYHATRLTNRTSHLMVNPDELHIYSIIGERREEFTFLVCAFDSDTVDEGLQFEGVRVQIPNTNTGQFVGRNYTPDCETFRVSDGDLVNVDVQEEATELFTILLPVEPSDDVGFESHEITPDENFARFILPNAESYEVVIDSELVGYLLITNVRPENNTNFGIQSGIEQIRDAISGEVEIDVDIMGAGFAELEFSIGTSDRNNTGLLNLAERDGTIQVQLRTLDDADIVMAFFPILEETLLPEVTPEATEQN